MCEHFRPISFIILLRHSVLENTWSKPAYILAVMLEEMRKPEGHQLK